MIPSFARETARASSMVGRLPMVADELTTDAVTASFRLIQRRRGHRFSVDDLATAWEAARVASPATATFLDLGCGVGSVLLMVAWRLPGARGFGIEAQDVSVELARRNVHDNGLGERVTLLHGDLREVTRAWSHGPCALVTGTPPYLPLGTASASPDPQRAAARIELRGGVEDYLAAAARVLSPEGLVVLCSDGRVPERVVRGAAAAGLSPVRRLDVVPKAGRPPLFSVWTCAWTPRGALDHAEVIMRDERGERTEASLAMRRAFGLGDPPPRRRG
jgi:tRNA1(Val) A37 N6-methylase TrmN6